MIAPTSLWIEIRPQADDVMNRSRRKVAINIVSEAKLLQVPAVF